MKSINGSVDVLSALNINPFQMKTFANIVDDLTEGDLERCVCCIDPGDDPLPITDQKADNFQRCECIIDPGDDPLPMNDQNSQEQTQVSLCEICCDPGDDTLPILDMAACQ
jgi:hypothetical protein